MAAEEKDYVLGTHDEEIARLGLQHAVWRPHATAAWRAAGFTAGHRVLDLGCGPGWGTLDLADIVGPRGQVIAVDRSRRFLGALERAAHARERTWIETHEQDLSTGPLPARDLDGVWARWVFAFVSGSRDLLARAVDALAPGGTIVIHEYVDYRAWRLSPRSAAFEEFVAEVMASWRAGGGEPDVGLDLPGWLEELGAPVRSLVPITGAPRVRDHAWQWPSAFVATGIDRLVELGRIDAAKGRAFREAYERFAATPHAFQVLPTVLEIIATKR